MIVFLSVHLQTHSSSILNWIHYFISRIIDYIWITLNGKSEFEELKREASRWIQTICWDGQIFFNKGVNFSAKYSLKDSKVATAFSFVADSAKQASDAFSSVANCTKQYSTTSNGLWISSNGLSSNLAFKAADNNSITMDNDGITFSNPIKSIRVGGTECQIQANTSNIKQELEELRQFINEHYKKENKEKENPSMFNNIMKNVKFGAVPSAEVRMSIYGPAFNTKDGWLAWSEKDNTYLDVSDMLLDMDNFCYMAPVAKKDVKPGDFIHHHNWLRVINLREDGRVVAEVILNQVETTLIPTKNVFGFDFYTKLISFGSNMFNASPDTPFGNMLPLLMMNKSDDSALPMLMMMNGGTMGNMSFDMSNPMFLYLMMNKGDSNTRDMLMMMAMMQNNTAVPCACGCHYTKED